MSNSQGEFTWELDIPCWTLDVLLAAFNRRYRKKKAMLALAAQTPHAAAAPPSG
jgi:hypothetical protein